MAAAPMNPPPLTGTNYISSAVARASYAESVESSPRSRTTETCDDCESLTAAPGGGKLRLMCSFGGHIIPRPYDKSLSYVGGDTRMVVVDRNISLSELHARLSRNLLHNRPFTLKYQLPSEDLDSLISVTSDEDLENMIDEFDRVCETSSVAKSSRLRVFLFVNNHESASSIDLLFGGSVKSGDWFYNASNGSKASERDDKSVNSLLGLEYASVRPGNSRELEADLSKNQKSHNQEVPHIPDSVVIETSSSSFGSTSSSLANLPPIKVRVDGDDVNGRNKVRDHKVGLEEQFAHMAVSAGGKQDEGFADMASPRPIPITIIPATVNPVGELPEWIITDDDERSDQGIPVGYGRMQTQSQPHTQLQQQLLQPPTSPHSATSDGSMLHQELHAGISRITSNNPRMQVQQKFSESGYIMHSQQQLQQLQQQLQQLQHHHLQQQQQNQQHQQQQQNQQHQQQNENQQQQQNQQNQNQQHQQQRQNQQNQNQQQQQNQQNLQQHQQNQLQQQQNQHQHQQSQHQHQQHQHQQNHQQRQQHQQQQEHLLQQQQQQQEHLQQQQQQQHQQQQQQQHQQQQQQHQQQLQPQQFIHSGTHYLRHPQNAVPMSQYYHIYPPQSQHHQAQLDQHQYPFYFIPPTSKQPQQAYNMSMQQATYSEPSNTVQSSRPVAPPLPTMNANTSAYNNQPRDPAQGNPEMVSGDYRAAIPSVQSMVQLAPGQHQQQYMTYPQVHHAPQSMAQPRNPAPAPAPTTGSSYAYEYSDPAHSQMYCTPQLAHPAQYQTMVSSSPTAML